MKKNIDVIENQKNEKTPFSNGNFSSIIQSLVSNNPIKDLPDKKDTAFLPYLEIPQHLKINTQNSDAKEKK